MFSVEQEFQKGSSRCALHFRDLSLNCYERYECGEHANLNVQNFLADLADPGDCDDRIVHRFRERCSDHDNMDTQDKMNSQSRNDDGDYRTCVS